MYIPYNAVGASRSHNYPAIYRCSPNVFDIVPITLLACKIHAVIGIDKSGIYNINITSRSPGRKGKGANIIGGLQIIVNADSP